MLPRGSKKRPYKSYLPFQHFCRHFSHSHFFLTFSVLFEIGDYENSLKICQNIDQTSLTTDQKSRINLRIAKSNYYLKNFSVAKQLDSSIIVPHEGPKEWPKVNCCRHTLIPAFEYYPIGNESAVALTDSEEEYPKRVDFDLLWNNGQKNIDLLFIGMSDLRHLLLTLQDIKQSQNPFS